VPVPVPVPGAVRATNAVTADANKADAEKAAVTVIGSAAAGVANKSVREGVRDGEEERDGAAANTLLTPPLSDSTRNRKQ